jgi:hypothetical protein
MRAPGATLLAAFLALAPVSVSAAGLAWVQWQPVAGVFDLGGPRSDGSLVVAGSANLYLVDPTGNVTPFARGPGGYREDAGAEAYLTVSPKAHVAATGCDFVRDEVFLLRLHVPLGIERVDAPGENTGSFTNVTGVTSLNGIAFDTTGAFDHRLLVSGPANGKTVITAIDCNGTTQVITSTAPTFEGGIAVAPMTFGNFGGYLIAPDELSGTIWAISPEGTANKLVDSGLPKGGDIGVESVAFVPPGFDRGGELHYSDRKTLNNPHPGTDNVLRMSSADLISAGVQDGDMLAATEGGASMIDVRCDTSCHVAPVVSVPTSAHGEGHLVFTMSPPPQPSRSPIAIPIGEAHPILVAPLVAIAVAVLAALAVVILAATRRRR